MKGAIVDYSDELRWVAESRGLLGQLVIHVQKDIKVSLERDGGLTKDGRESWTCHFCATNGSIKKDTSKRSYVNGTTHKVIHGGTYAIVYQMSGYADTSARTHPGPTGILIVHARANCQPEKLLLAIDNCLTPLSIS